MQVKNAFQLLVLAGEAISNPKMSNFWNYLILKPKNMFCDFGSSPNSEKNRQNCKKRKYLRTFTNLTAYIFASHLVSVACARHLKTFPAQSRRKVRGCKKDPKKVKG